MPPKKTKQSLDGYELDNAKVGIVPIHIDIKHKIKEALLAQFNSSEYKGWTTGSEYFNELTGGMADIVTLAGSPGGTKSSVARWLSLNFLNANRYNKVLFLSAEDNKDEFHRLITCLMLNINKDIFKADFKQLCPQLKVNTFGEFLIKQMMKGAQNDPATYKKYHETINRFEYKTKGDGAFENKDTLIHSIIDTLIGYSNGVSMNKPVNELLVVLDHLGEFNLSNTENEYERANDILETVMSLSGGYQSLDTAYFKKRVGGKNPFVYNIMDKINGDPQKEKEFNDCMARMKGEYEDFLSSQGMSSWDDLQKEIISELNIPRVKFLLLSQFKTDAYKSGNWKKQTYELNTSDLESSKRLGQKTFQAFFCWKEESPFVPNKVKDYYSTGCRPSDIKAYLQPISTLTYLFCSKNRIGFNNWICPVFSNLATGSMIPFSLKTEKIDGTLNPYNIKQFRDEFGLDFRETSNKEDLPDTAKTWSYRHKLLQRDIFNGSVNVHHNSYVSSFKQSQEEQNEFYKFFDIDSLFR